MVKTNIAKQFKYLRKSKGWTQQQISNELNITRSAYANYETGKRTPSPDCIARMADLFSTTVDFILGADSHPEAAAIGEAAAVCLSSDEQKLLELYRSLNPDSRKEVIIYCRFRKKLSEDSDAI